MRDRIPPTTVPNNGNMVWITWYALITYFHYHLPLIHQYLHLHLHLSRPSFGFYKIIFTVGRQNFVVVVALVTHPTNKMAEEETGGAAGGEAAAPTGGEATSTGGYDYRKVHNYPLIKARELYCISLSK